MVIIPWIFALWLPVEARCEDYSVETKWSRENPLSGSVEDFSLLDKSGKVKWSIEVNQPASLVPLNKGCALMIRELAPEASRISLDFLDYSGKIVNTSKVAYFSGFEVSDDRERILIRSRSGLSLFALDGKLLNQYAGVFNGMALDDLGDRVAMTNADFLFVYKGDENLARIDLSNPYVRQIDFSQDGNRIAVLTQAGIEIYDYNKGHRVYDLRLLESSPKHVCFSRTGEQLLVAMKDERTLKLLVFNYGDLSNHTFTQLLSSEDEAVIGIVAFEDGWLVHLSSGWFKFSEDEK